jgi:hypothetical protein
MMAAVYSTVSSGSLPGSASQELGAFGWLADDGLAVPVVSGFEREPDAGVGACGVALADGQGKVHGGGASVMPVSSLVSRTAASRMFSPSSRFWVPITLSQSLTWCLVLDEGRSG